MSTKDYSTIQETRIANYLDWSVVAGSGARPCKPGDIYSDDWLGECKTHVKHSKIIFNKSHWLKLDQESTYSRKYPVLFTDDGSQKIENTWAMFSKVIYRPNYNILSSNLIGSASVSFDHSSIISKFSKLRDADKLNVFIIKLSDLELYLTPLSEFKHILHEVF